MKEEAQKIVDEQIEIVRGLGQRICGNAKILETGISKKSRLQIYASMDVILKDALLIKKAAEWAMMITETDAADA